MNLKKTFISGLISISVLYSYAQVGIKTQSPQGIFHIDGNGNTSGTSNLSDDLIIASDGGSSVNIALGGMPIKGSSIALYSDKKGFLPPRVSLTSALDITTVPNPQEGMIIYNIANSGQYPNSTIPGYYIYNGTRWKRLMTQGYTGAAETIYLKNNISTIAVGSTSSVPTLDFGNITIYNDGAYAFSFNIDATSSTGALAQRTTNGEFYIYMYKKGVDDSDYVLVKSATIYPSLFPDGQSFSTTTIMGVELKSQDHIIFKAKHADGLPTITFKSNYTYVLFWQL